MVIIGRLIALGFLMSAFICFSMTGAQANPLPPYDARVCQMPGPTQINVIPTTKDIKYDYSKSLQAIQSVETDTRNPYGLHSLTVTQGFMKGQVKFEPSVTLDYKIVPKSNTACLWYKDISLNIEITPTIVIGREVGQDRCMRAAVIEHEHKHVKVDREIVNKYARRMGEKIYERLSQQGFIFGPVASKSAEDVANFMHDSVHDVLKEEYRIMEHERAAAQQAVDSRAEYDRVAKLCPDFNPSNYVQHPKRAGHAH